MKRLLLLPLLSLMICVSLISCDKNHAASSAVKTRILRLGHSAPPGSTMDVVAQKIAKEINQKTKGEIIIQIYPGAQLGDEMVMLDALMTGTLEMNLTGTPIMANVMPEFNALSMPFLFRDTDEFFAVVTSDEFIAKSNQITETKGVVLLGYPCGEMRGLSNVKREVRTPADLRGLKIRVMNGPLYTDIFQSLGAITATLPFGEVYTALQQGVVDGEDNGVNMLDLMKFMEVEKYHTALGHTVQTNPFLINRDVWNVLTEEQRKIIQEAVNVQQKAYPGEILKPQIEASRKKVKAAGVKVVMELTPAEYQAFKSAVAPVYQKYRRVIGEDFFNFVNQQIEAYRNLR